MLAICCLSLFIVGLDITIVNVALPAIGRDFAAPVEGLQCVASGIASTSRLALVTTGRTATASAARTASLIASASGDKLPARVA